MTVAEPHERLRFVPIKAADTRSIVREVAERHGLTMEDLLGPSRTRAVAHPRQEAFALVRERRPHLSLPQIGRVFNRDHTTVLYGIRTHYRRQGEAK